MRELVWTNTFIKNIKKLSKNDSRLKDRLKETVQILAENPFDSRLETHKLKGRLEGLWAASIDYQNRLIFTFQDDIPEDSIVLVAAGTHDEVY